MTYIYAFCCSQLKALLDQGSIISASPDKTVNKRSPAKKLKPRKMKLN